MGRKHGAYAIRSSRHSASTEWMRHGHCADITDIERRWFFADNDPSAGAVACVLQAKMICEGCPEEARCLAFALSQKMHGVWGGLTQRERNAIPKPQREALITASGILTSGG